MWANDYHASGRRSCAVDASANNKVELHQGLWRQRMGLGLDIASVSSALLIPALANHKQGA